MGRAFRQITKDMRREIAGVVLMALGLLAYLALFFPKSGVIGRDLGHGLVVLFGLFAWVVPLGVLVAGLARILNKPSWAVQARGFGILLSYIGLAVMAGLWYPSWAGAVGLGMKHALVGLVGIPGTMVVVFLVLIVGILLWTGGSLVTGSQKVAQFFLGCGRIMGDGSQRFYRVLRDWIYPVEEEVQEPKKPRKNVSSVTPVAESQVTESFPTGERSRPVARPPENPDLSSHKAGASPSRAIFMGDNMQYLPPPLSLLAAPDLGRGSRKGQSAWDRAEVLATSLKQFGIAVKLGDVSQGPTITRFEIIPPPGVKVSRIVNLADDIALSLAATGVRIEAPIPGKSAVGIEVPNDEITMVLLREVLESDQFAQSASPLTVGLGRDVAGSPVVAALDKMPHLLVAGATGSGKSVLINSLISSLLFRSSPEVVRLLLIDPKVVELSVYNGIPHLLSPVVTDPKKASGALRWAVAEMERRYRMFADVGVRDVGRFNQLKGEHLPYIVVVIDELADLMMVAPHEVEESIARLAQMARAAGIHLVVATQRPSVDVITGTIKANIPSRIAFAVSSQVDSRTILDSAGAEKLLGRGDMLFNPVGAPKALRIQGAFIHEKEIEEIVQYLNRQTSPASSFDDVPDFSQGEESVPIAEETDSLFQDAVRIVVEGGQASTSMLQRRMRVGYTRAARLIDAMEERGFIGPQEGAKARDVRITEEQYHRLFNTED